MTAENIQNIRIDLQNLYTDEKGVIKLPQGDGLEKLKAENPHYSDQGHLYITDPADIALLTGACQESSLAENNGLCRALTGKKKSVRLCDDEKQKPVQGQPGP